MTMNETTNKQNKKQQTKKSRN